MAIHNHPNFDHWCESSSSDRHWRRISNGRILVATPQRRSEKQRVPEESSYPIYPHTRAPTMRESSPGAYGSCAACALLPDSGTRDCNWNDGWGWSPSLIVSHSGFRKLMEIAQHCQLPCRIYFVTKASMPHL